MEGVFVRHGVEGAYCCTGGSVVLCGRVGAPFRGVFLCSACFISVGVPLSVRAVFSCVAAAFAIDVVCLSVALPVCRWVTLGCRWVSLGCRWGVAGCCWDVAGCCGASPAVPGALLGVAGSALEHNCELTQHQWTSSDVLCVKKKMTLLCCNDNSSLPEAIVYVH